MMHPMMSIFKKRHNSDWALFSDEQTGSGSPFSLLNHEQMSNKVRVEHQPGQYQKFPTRDVCFFSRSFLQPRNSCIFSLRVSERIFTMVLSDRRTSLFGAGFTTGRYADDGFFSSVSRCGS